MKTVWRWMPPEEDLSRYQELTRTYQSVQDKQKHAAATHAAAIDAAPATASASSSSPATEADSPQPQAAASSSSEAPGATAAATATTLAAGQTIDAQQVVSDMLAKHRTELWQTVFIEKPKVKRVRKLKVKHPKGGSSDGSCKGSEWPNDVKAGNTANVS